MHKVVSLFKNIAPLLFLILGVFFLLIPRILPIREVTCESQYGPCDDEVTEAITKYKAASLRDAKWGIESYLADQNNIAKYETRFLIPDKLKVSVIQRKAEFGISKGSSSVALVDRNGHSLSYQEKTLLPILHIDGNPPQVGENVDKKTLFALGILAYMNRFYSVNDGILSDGKVVFRLKEGQTIIFPDVGDTGTLVGGLVLIISQLNKDGDKLKINDSLGVCGSSCTLDLRFKNPVIKI